MSENNSTEKKSCCGCDCCDSAQVAKLLRHIAEFFEK